MSANNVRCAGQWIEVTDDGRDDRLYLASCGWKGERVTDLRAATLSTSQYRHAATAKPCPRCGAKVTLIEDGGR